MEHYRFLCLLLSFSFALSIPTLSPYIVYYEKRTNWNRMRWPWVRNWPGCMKALDRYAASSVLWTPCLLPCRQLLSWWLGAKTTNCSLPPWCCEGWPRHAGHHLATGQIGLGPAPRRFGGEGTAGDWSLVQPRSHDGRWSCRGEGLQPG